MRRVWPSCLLLLLATRTQQNNDYSPVDYSDESAGDNADNTSPTCGVPAIAPNFNSRIVGGEEVRPHSWPWLCSVRMKISTGNLLCGASLITDRFLLTASHCMFYEKARLATSAVHVSCGEHNMDYGEETAQFKSVARTYVHPQYNPTLKDHDVAVIELTTPVNFNRVVSPVCLVQKDVADYTTCVVAGWGRTNYYGVVSTILNQVVLPVVPWPVCKKSYDTLTQNMMCAGYPEGGKDACQGDSGGPFVCKVDNHWEIHGIVSFGYRCAKPGHPGIFTRVSRYLNWINDVTDGAVSKAATTHT